MRQTFNDSLQAREWEHKVLRRLDAVQDERWLNRTDNKSLPPPYGNTWNKGVSKSSNTKQKFREANLGKRLSEETKQKLKKPKSEKTKQKMSAAAKRKETRSV